MSSMRLRALVSAADRESWNVLASRSPVGHRHQCLWWMEPLESYGVRTHPIGCWDGGQLVGGALFRSYPVPFTGTRVCECLDGPIFLRWESGWADELARGIVQLGRETNSMAMIIRDCPHPDVHRDLLAAFEERALSLATIPGPADAVLRLEGKTIDHIRSGFNRGTRGRINKAQRGPLTVRHLTAPEDLANAYAAWMATANRKSFSDVRPWPGLEPVLRHCIDQDLGSVLGSFAEHRLVAAAFITYVGSTAAYVYGGYMDGAEKLSPTHVLQYEAIRESLEKGMSAYNFGYLISGYQATAKGVDDFKLGFGAEPHQHLDTIVWKRRPLLYQSIERLRRGWIGRNLEAFARNRMIRRGKKLTS
jgi:hypothetical protein